MEIIFWLLMLAVCYSYFIYPVILLVLIKKDQHADTGNTSNKTLPYLSLIITAHNEEKNIGKKLENSLALDYPDEIMEIIVASDCSTDKTDELVTGLDNPAVRLVRTPERRGKENAQHLAIQHAKGDILVFSDAATTIPADAFNIIAEIFDNPKIGAVSSVDRFVSQDNQIVGEGLYVKYEMWLRGLESKVAGLVGLSGSFFAARRDVCQNWDILAPSDFNTALNCAELGYLAVSDLRLVGIYMDVKDSSEEVRRKIRTIIRGLTAVSRKPGVLNPLKYGLFSFQMWGHKIMRWLVPWLLLVIFIMSYLLYGRSEIYAYIFWIQITIYAIVLIGMFSESSRSSIFVRIPYYFALSNIAIASATIAFVRGKRVTMWEPSKR